MKKLQAGELPALDVAGWLNTDGKSIDLKDLKGKPVVVEFWATWCPPCRDAIPHLNELHSKHADDGLVIAGIHNPSGADRGSVERFAKQHKMEFPIGLDKSGKVSEAYGVKGIPEAFVIDRGGKLIWAGHPGDSGFDRAVEIAVRSDKPN
jgi:thiol-disulfide isomerase/thioredoxin